VIKPQMNTDETRMTCMRCASLRFSKSVIIRVNPWPILVVTEI
jgi:hypothetical protein